MSRMTADLPLGRVSTVDALAASLRERILSGAIAPGAQLREIELSERYGVGRHSLRAAFQALAHEGLLSHEPHRGVFVPQLDAGDVRDLFLVRTALEVEAVRLLVTRGLAVDAAVAATEALEALTGGEPWNEVVELDLDFHRELIAAVGSPRLDRGFAGLQAELRLLLAQLQPSYERPEKVGGEHRVLLDAILSGDVERAVAAMREHLELGTDELVAVVGEPGAH
jgi:DNA-binding GntR family transcriptional regulator